MDPLIFVQLVIQMAVTAYPVFHLWYWKIQTNVLKTAILESILT